MFVLNSQPMSTAKNPHPSKTSVPSTEFLADSDVFEHFLLGGGDELAVATPSPTIARMLGSRNFLRAEGLSESAAERSVDILITALENAGIFIDRPFHLDGRAYYRWLRNDFLQTTVDFPVGDGWRTHFTYAELVPRSAQAMYVPVQAALEDLLTHRDGRSAYHFADARYERMRSALPEWLTRYVAAWHAAYPAVSKEMVRPLAGERVGADNATLRFEVAYDVQLEDESAQTFRGEGRATLRFCAPYYEITSLQFPGFSVER